MINLLRNMFPQVLASFPPFNPPELNRLEEEFEYYK